MRRRGAGRRCPLPEAPRRSDAARPPARAAPRRPGGRALPALDQRQLDLIGLGLVALGRLPRLPALPRLGRRRGRGAGSSTACAGSSARSPTSSPVALVAAGAILVLRPVLPAVRPFRAGGAVPVRGADARARRRHARPRPGRRARPGLGTPLGRAARRHGRRGALLGRPRRCSATVGAHILAVFLFLAGVLLLTGASVAGVLKATTRLGVARHHAGAARRHGDDARRGAPRDRRARRGATRRRSRRRRAAVRPSRRRAAPASSTAPERFPDLFGEAAAGARRRAAGRGGARARARARGGRRRSRARRPRPSRRRRRRTTPRAATAASVTRARRTSSSVAARRPTGFLKRSSAEPSAPGHRRPGEGRAAQLIEALGHFGVEAKVIGMVAGPHITRYELRLAPGHQGRQGRPAQGRPRLRARRDRHPHPRADPRQAGGRRRGAQRAPPDRPPRRRLPGAARRTGRR